MRVKDEVINNPSGKSFVPPKKQKKKHNNNMILMDQRKRNRSVLVLTPHLLSCYLLGPVRVQPRTPGPVVEMSVLSALKLS